LRMCRRRAQVGGEREKKKLISQETGMIRKAGQWSGGWGCKTEQPERGEKRGGGGGGGRTKKSQNKTEELLEFVNAG